MLIAHRGEVTKYTKENTYNAVYNALMSDKYDGVEIDIRQTKDKKLVLVHDPIYKNKLIRNTNYNKLKKDLTLLDDILKIKTNKIILIEIKDTNINKQKLINKLNKYKNIYVMSFNKKYIQELSKLNHKFKLGYLNYIINSEDNYKEYDFICLLNRIITNKIIDYFTKEKIEIFSYGIFKEVKINNQINYIVDENDKILFT